jgi:hypothetical protein
MAIAIMSEKVASFITRSVRGQRIPRNDKADPKPEQLFISVLEKLLTRLEGG